MRNKKRIEELERQLISLSVTVGKQKEIGERLNDRYDVVSGGLAALIRRVEKIEEWKDDWHYASHSNIAERFVDADIKVDNLVYQINERLKRLEDAMNNQNMITETVDLKGWMELTDNTLDDLVRDYKMLTNENNSLRQKVDALKKKYSRNMESLHNKMHIMREDIEILRDEQEDEQ